MLPYPRGRMTLFPQCETEASTLEGHDQYCPMASTKSDPRETPRHFRGPGVHVIMIMGLLLPAFMTAKVEEESLAGPKITDSILTKNATDAGVVTKTAFSSKLRMSILVGLEGSGHHYLLNAVDDMFLTNGEISIDTTPCITTGPYLTLSSMKSSPLHYTEMLKRARGEMHDLALREESLPRTGHLVRLCSEMSYPTGHEEYKALRYIDLRLLAEIAEKEGVDLRVIYLRRSAHDILMADTVHRHFQKYIGLDPNTTSSSDRFSVYSLILLTDAAVMHSLIAEIDSAFIVCHDYRHAGEEEQASRIANFVAPNPVIAEMYNNSLFKTWNKKRHSETEELPFEEAEVLADRLQQKLNVFELPLCG